MKIDLEKIEKLAALKLSDEEKVSLEKDLEEIISYFENLKEVDTFDVSEMVYSENAELFLRDDEVKEGLSQKDLKLLRELYLDGFFKVKKIIGE